MFEMDVIKMSMDQLNESGYTNGLRTNYRNMSQLVNENASNDAFENLIPALIQCFGLIFAGYFAGRINLLTQSQGRGIGIFVGSFAMPAMLFKSMVELQFSSVNWYFLLAIFLSKLAIFIAVAVLTLLLIRPVNTGIIGIYGIFSTQSHDFALGIPIVQALYAHTHPEYETYLYLIAPISVAFLNPAGFLLMEIQRWREASPGVERSRGRALFMVLARVFTNPIVFMTILGIIFNYIFHQHIPMALDSLLTVLKNAFPGTALFCLGLSMVGRISSNGGKINVITPGLLIAAKMLVSPFLIRELVNTLNAQQSNATMADSLSTYGFLYGVFPTAPSVFIYATQYGYEAEMMATGMVVSTFISAPLMFLSARMITLTQASKDSFVTLLNRTSFDISIIGIIACVWVIVVFIMHRRSGTLPHKFTTGLVIAQCLSAIGMILWRTLDMDVLWQHYIHFIIFFVGVLSSRFWMAGIAVTLCLLRIYSIRFILKIHGWIILCCTALPILLCGILIICAHRDPKAMGPGVQYGMWQEVIAICCLIVTIIATVVALILQHRWRVVCRRVCWPETPVFDNSSGANDTIESQSPDLVNLTPNEGGGDSEEINTINVNATPRPRKPRRIKGKPRNARKVQCNNGSDLARSAPSRTVPIMTNIEDLVPDTTINRGRDIIDCESSEFDPLVSNSNGSVCGGCDISQRSRCSELLKSYQSRNYQITEDDEEELVLLQERDEFQTTRHIVLILLLLISSLVGLFLNLWRLMRESQTGVYIEIEFLDNVLLYGQGIVTFAVFGLDGEMVIEPLINRIKHWMAKHWPNIATRFTKKKIKAEPLESITKGSRNTCAKFLRFHYENCFKDIVSDRSRGSQSYTSVFAGRNLIDWLIEVGLCDDRGEGLAYGRHLLTGGVIEHVHQDHHFYDLPYLYHFTEAWTSVTNQNIF